MAAGMAAGRPEPPSPVEGDHRRAPAEGAQRAGGAVKGRRWRAALRRTWHDRPGRIRLGRQGLRFRVYLLVSIGVLAPAALVAGVSWTRLRELDEELVAARRHAAVAVAEHIDEELTADLEVLQRLASAPQLGLDRDRLDGARTLLRAAYLHS